MLENQIFHEIEDNRLHRFLRKEILKRPECYKKLKQLLYCGTRNIKIGGQSGTHIISNGVQTRILGIKRCDNSWGCPVCTARVMRKHAQNIGAGITKLKELNLVPIMITFTVFHTVQERASEVLQVLKETFSGFTKNAKWKRKKADGTYYTSGGAWNRFYTEYNIEHHVKVMEVTYGKHGWHPHFHNLYWIPKDKLAEIADWEEELKAQWRDFEDKAAKKIFSEEHYKLRCEMYKRCDKKHADKTGYTEGLYISKDANGKARAMEAADYICGWGGENELTGSDQKQGGLKAGQEGHYTLNELLNAGYNGDKKLLDKYLEWLITVSGSTPRTHRIEYSRTGLKALILEYKRTEAYRDCMKKKRTHIVAEIAPYHTVAYFKKEDWQEICWYNLTSEIPIIELIISFAKYANGYDLIKEAMEVNNLPLPLKKAPVTDMAEIFNDMLEHQWDNIEDFRNNALERTIKTKLAIHYVITSLKEYYAKRGYKPELGY